MKRIICAVVILALSISAALCASSLTDRHLSRMKDEVERMRSDDAATLQDAAHLEQQWKDSQNLLALFTDHAHLDTVSASIVSICAHIKHPSDPVHQAQLETEYDNLLYLLDHLISKEKFDINNIL